MLALGVSSTRRRGVGVGACRAGWRAWAGDSTCSACDVWLFFSRDFGFTAIMERGSTRTCPLPADAASIV